MNKVMDRQQSSARPPGGLARTIAAYDAMASDYAARFDKVELASDRARFVEALESNRVLDAGCGHGRDCRLFEEDGIRVVGADLSGGLLAEAERRTTAPLVRADVRRLPFSDGSFDGVWSCAVLHHLDALDLRVAISEMYRVASEGGRVFVSVRFGEEEELRPFCQGKARWFQFYRDDTLHSLIVDAGFIVDSVEVAAGEIAGEWVNVHARKPRREEVGHE